ncbi:uncharacterized protein METZ01_LOCUS93485, partial [marine metagenome]
LWESCACSSGETQAPTNSVQTPWG